MLITSEHSLKRIFTDAVLADGNGDKSPSADTGSAVIMRVKKIRDFAFVHFSDRQHALTAMNRLNGLSYKILQSCVLRTSFMRFYNYSFTFESSVVRPAAALRPKQVAPSPPLYASLCSPAPTYTRLQRPVRLAPWIFMIDSQRLSLCSTAENGVVHINYVVTCTADQRRSGDPWPFDLEDGLLVTCDVGYLCANFSLSRPPCSRLRPDVRDRQTSDVRASSPNDPAY